MHIVAVRKNQYQDSVRLMAISREASALPNVSKTLALLGTDSNKLVVAKLGLASPEVEGASASDLLVCVEAADGAAADAAVARVDALLRRAPAAAGDVANPSSIEEAKARLPGATVALFSIPGPFAKLDVVAALEQGLHVMLFSDNVTVEDEVELKTRAAARELLLMGPDCGTAILDGVPLAFANIVRRGDIGVVGASGTGVQELTCLVDRLGGGISHAIGVGGRDLKKAVGGIMMSCAVRKLAADPATRRLVLVSKPGDPAVVRRVLAEAAATGKEVVACFLGADRVDAPLGVRVVRTLEAAALAVMGAAGADGRERRDTEVAVRRARKLPAERRWLRGLYSGGTLCYETLLLAAGRLEIESNVAPAERLHLAHPARGRAHCCVDLGEDEFTNGRPHPMIDSTLRVERFAEELADPSVKVLLLDFVLGHGAHPDPASDFVRVLAERRAGARDPGPVVIGHVCGTAADPQGLEAQEARLREAGVLLFSSNAAAARAAFAAVEAS